MRITGLKLANFRGFERLNMDFHPNLTVLVGVNGSGKTTILNAIVAVLAKLTEQPLSLGVNDVQRNSDQASVTISFDNLSTDPQLVLKKNSGGIKSIPGGYPEGLDAKEGPLPLFCYFPDTRNAKDMTPGSTTPGVWHPSSAWDNALNLSNINFDSLFKWFREREDVENEEYRENANYMDPQLEAVRKALEKLLPGYSKPRIRRPKFNGDSKQVATDKPVLAITKNGEELAFNQFSAGERTMSSLAFDIARRLSIANPGLADPLTGNGVVLIDEIDLHLHPEWQRKVIPALLNTFPNIQFIVATHSPMVLGYVKDESVRILEDFAIVDAPKTKGRDPNSLYLEIFGVPLRESNVEKHIEKIADLIDEDNLTEARKELDKLGEALGDGDVEYIRLNTLIAMLED